MRARDLMQQEPLKICIYAILRRLSSEFSYACSFWKYVIEYRYSKHFHSADMPLSLFCGMSAEQDLSENYKSFWGWGFAQIWRRFFRCFFLALIFQRDGIFTPVFSTIFALILVR